MSLLHERTPLFAHFLKSDATLWIRFVPALPLEAAFYYDAIFGAGALHRFLLHVAPSAGTGGCRAYRLALEVGSHTAATGSLIFDVSSAKRDLVFESSDLDLVDANWPRLEDPLVWKAHEIVMRCKNRFGPSPTTAALYQRV